MGTGYTRNDTSNNIADGNIINASDLDGEFDAVEAAFNSSTGHTHDGTSAEGAPITVVGPVQDLVVSATEVKPKTTNTLDIGTGSLQFKDLHLDGTAYLDDVQAVGAVDITGDLDVDNININGNTIISTDTNGDINISPDGTGTVIIDTDLDVDNININGNTISSTDTNGNITLAPNGTGVVALSSTDLTFGDNDKAIFGAGSDLQIYHDGLNSYIQDDGTGNLFIQASNVLWLRNATGTAYFSGASAGEAALYYNGGEKIATKSGGVDVTGTVTADGVLNNNKSEFFASESALVSTGSTAKVYATNSTFDGVNGSLVLQSRPTAGADVYIATGTTPKKVAKFDDGGDISFYDSTGVSQGLFYQASTQRLGLGTTSPDKNLHVYHASTNRPALIESGDADALIEFKDSSTTNVPAIGASGDDLIVQTGTSALTRMTITSGGNVGIGATNVPYKLVVSNGGASSIEIEPAYSGTSNLIQHYNRSGAVYVDAVNIAGQHRFSIGATEAMRIDSSGNVGIGTSSPTYKFQIAAGTDHLVTYSASAVNSNIFFDTQNTSTGASAAVVQRLITSDVAGTGTTSADIQKTKAGALVINNNETNSAAYTGFGVGPSERMRIDSSGNVGIGTTTTTRAKLNIDTDGTNTSAGYGISLTNTAGGGSTWTLQCGDHAVDNGAFTIRETGISGTTYLKLGSGNGYLTAAGVYALTTASSANVNVDANGALARSTSSMRYKNTINDATHGLTELLALRPVTYKGNNNGDTIFGGLIAEEVHDAGLTEFVEYDDEGRPDALAYGNMVSLCIKAIQEQQATITALEARIAALEAN
jgi:hypothetical protein